MNNKGKKWTAEDDNFLVEKWGSLKLESIAKILVYILGKNAHRLK